MVAASRERGAGGAGRALRCTCLTNHAAPQRFRAFQPWLLERYGRPVHRVALDAGSTCPNRDGTKGFGGCTYCDVEGSGTGALESGVQLAAQLDDGLARIARRGEDVGAVAYFQSYSNTYVDDARLAEVLGVVASRLGGDADSTRGSDARATGATTGSPAADRDSAKGRSAIATRPPIVAVSLATRPDTLSESALDRLAALARRVDVWLELGLETANDDVQRAIHRLHTLAEFEDAVARAKARGLFVVGHAILGLPGDGREGARATADALARTGVDGVKVHQLMILRRTQMEKQWRRGEIEVLEPAEYVEWLADFVERLAPDQVLHRVTGDALDRDLLAPRWNVHKNAIREGLESALALRGTRQGARRAVDAG